MFRDDLAPAKLSKYPCDPIGRARARGAPHVSASSKYITLAANQSALR